MQLGNNWRALGNGQMRRPANPPNELLKLSRTAHRTEVRLAATKSKLLPSVPLRSTLGYHDTRLRRSSS